jgi:hypothetical protein
VARADLCRPACRPFARSQHRVERHVSWFGVVLASPAGSFRREGQAVKNHERFDFDVGITSGGAISVNNH